MVNKKYFELFQSPVLVPGHAKRQAIIAFCVLVILETSKPELKNTLKRVQ